MNKILKELENLKKENNELKKILMDYCYIDNFPNGEVIKMCCESYESSNVDDFNFIKSIIE